MESHTLTGWKKDKCALQQKKKFNGRNVKKNGLGMSHVCLEFGNSREGFCAGGHARKD